MYRVIRFSGPHRPPVISRLAMAWVESTSRSTVFSTWSRESGSVCRDDLQFFAQQTGLDSDDSFLHVDQGLRGVLTSMPIWAVIEGLGSLALVSASISRRSRDHDLRHVWDHVPGDLLDPVTEPAPGLFAIRSTSLHVRPSGFVFRSDHRCRGLRCPLPRPKSWVSALAGSSSSGRFRAVEGFVPQVLPPVTLP